MSTPASRTPKRQRKKEGAQARRAAELAALRRAQRNRRVIRFLVIGGVVLAILLLISWLGGDDSSNEEAASTTTTSLADTSSTSVAPPVEPLTCDGPDGSNTDTTKKPVVAVPAEAATVLTCRDLVVGNGREVSENDTITVHYAGNAQSNGKEFDASWDGEPATFTLSRGSLIDGWVEGIPGMKVGGRRVLTIPGDKAYGAAGRPPDIGPNDTLVFIIDVKDAKPAG
jgi:peptidylprolyl isomerase